MGSQRVGHNWATDMNWVNAPQRILLCCKLVLFFSLFLFYLKGSSSAVLFIWLISLRVWTSKVHPSGHQWHNFIISVVLFCGWVIEFHGERSLADCSPQSFKESNTIETNTFIFRFLVSWPNTVQPWEQSLLRLQGWVSRPSQGGHREWNRYLLCFFLFSLISFRC